MYKWLIIGGGIHGTYISNYLHTKGFCDSEKIAVLDPFEEPLRNWKFQTSNTGMDYLRSPAEHNLDVGSGSLFNYANRNNFGKDHFHKTFKRPNLHLFNRHCLDVIEKRNLASMRLKGQARTIRKSESGGYIVGTNNGDLVTESLVLSLGAGENLRIPVWAKRHWQSLESIQHIFCSKYKKPDYKNCENIAVVGSGITAAQVVLQYSKQKPGCVYLISYGELISRELDFDPCWTMNRCLNNFQREQDYTKRRVQITRARNKGTVPPSIMKELRKEIKNGNIIEVHSSISDLSIKDGEKIEVRLSNGANQEFDYLCLATGFSQEPPGGRLLKQLAKNVSVSTAPCGYPIVDKHLQIAKNIFVSGALAELELGPASRNIIGAKLAVEKIVRANHKLKLKSSDLKYFYFQSRRSN